MDPVTSSQNPFIKYLMKLKTRKFREREGKFLIEGTRFVEEALASNWPVECLIYSEDLIKFGSGSHLVPAAGKMKIKVFPVAVKLIEELAFTETPQGVLALCAMKAWRLADLGGQGQGGQAGKSGPVVVADGVSDPGNLGTIIRSADAFGAKGAIVARGSVDLYNSKTLRATMGSVFHMPVVCNADPHGVYRWLKESGSVLLIGVPHGGVSLDRLDLVRPLALVVGNEAYGPSREFFSLPHEKATIPMPGGAESLNAAVAASVMLYEAARQRGRAARGE